LAVAPTSTGQTRRQWRSTPTSHHAPVPAALPQAARKLRSSAAGSASVCGPIVRTKSPASPWSACGRSVGHDGAEPISARSPIPGGPVPARSAWAPFRDRLYRGKLEAGLSPSTVVMINNIVHRALDAAVRRGLIGRNPAKLVELPWVQKRAVGRLEDDQLGGLLIALAEHRLGSVRSGP